MRPEDPPDPIDPVVDDFGRTVSLGENTIPSWKDKTVVVKLLGRKISYHVMSSRLQAIWKTKQALQILDLEND
ncbi:hypothetical protein J1N35_021638 [Gossypium stocksii]|uniref:Uncharacterized protein n=1 Tax=Gossypium stocksii TaxID=47602 RepID=A0A9D4A212_9ROSI|nr:hypothetical protein J1N35_021638 [Gossypium stocksii]